MTVATALLDRPTEGPDRRPRVLLVEDDVSARQAMASALRAAGHDVTAVASSTQALAVLVSVRPDVLLTGLSMPDMDGLELVRTLRVREVTVPVLIIGAPDERVAAFDAGCNAFLATPFGLGDLLSRVSGLAVRCG